MLLRFRNTDPGFAVNNRTYVTMLAPGPEFTPETVRQWYARGLLPLTPIYPASVSELGHDSQPATTSTVSPGYLRNGARPQHRRPDGPPVAIVNQTLATRLWSGQPASGKRLLLGCRDPVSLSTAPSRKAPKGSRTSWLKWDLKSASSPPSSVRQYIPWPISGSG
ncbi:MAG TPA: hypothetical protein VMR62_25605 [Bryobacteraceae bacterium]|nr:hypothetical protein [Bryobacteraceae bacterium]